LELQAFVARRVVTPEGIRPGAILVEGERIQAVIAPDQVSDRYQLHDFGDAAILPGLVDSHVHINDPGRAEWEGFETATRAAAAGGYTMLVDMPLNCLPATTTVAALQAKRAAARGNCRVDWAAWGGVVHNNESDIEPLAAAGVPGFKCFLVNPGIDGFTMVTEQQLRSALPHVARTGLPLLVHAELPGPIDRATEALANADWSRYSTYLQSRIRISLAHCAPVDEPGAARTPRRTRRRTCGQRRDLPSLSASFRRNNRGWSDLAKMCAARSKPRELREIVAGAPRRHD
jgi:allantoinase